MFKELDSFSSSLGKVVIQEFRPNLRDFTCETFIKLCDKGRYLVLCERNGELSVRNFQYKNQASDLWDDLAYSLNPKRPAKKENRVLHEYYNPNGGKLLTLLALWNTKYAVDFAALDSCGGIERERIIKKNYRDALALYQQKQKELCPDNQKQK